MPTEIVRHIMEDHNVKKILWAAIGDIPESWFYAFELKNGEVILRLGEGAPEAMLGWFDQTTKSASQLKTLRVQFGNGGSFVMWSQSRWACINVPDALLSSLRDRSNCCPIWYGVTNGKFDIGKLHLNLLSL
jgi:hypothetical protein